MKKKPVTSLETDFKKLQKRVNQGWSKLYAVSDAAAEKLKESTIKDARQFLSETVWRKRSAPKADKKTPKATKVRLAARSRKAKGKAPKRPTGKSKKAPK